MSQRSLSRTGDKPRIHVSAEHVIDEIVKTVNGMKDKEFKSIAIICKTKSMAGRIYDEMKERVEGLNLIDSENSEFKIGLNVISLYLAKGLEFDGVIVADGEGYLRESNMNLFYTVCTRDFIN